MDNTDKIYLSAVKACRAGNFGKATGLFRLAVLDSYQFAPETRDAEVMKHVGRIFESHGYERAAEESYLVALDVLETRGDRKSSLYVSLKKKLRSILDSQLDRRLELLGISVGNAQGSGPQLLGRAC